MTDHTPRITGSVPRPGIWLRRRHQEQYASAQSGREFQPRPQGTRPEIVALPVQRAPDHVMAGFRVADRSRLFCGQRLVRACLHRPWAGRHSRAPIADAPDAFWQSFFFSVHKMSTVGYGHVVPVTFSANNVMTIQSIVSLFGLALGTLLLAPKRDRALGGFDWTPAAARFG